MVEDEEPVEEEPVIEESPDHDEMWIIFQK